MNHDSTRAVLLLLADLPQLSVSKLEIAAEALAQYTEDLALQLYSAWNGIGAWLRDRGQIRDANECFDRADRHLKSHQYLAGGSLRSVLSRARCSVRLLGRWESEMPLMCLFRDEMETVSDRATRLKGVRWPDAVSRVRDE